jgi:AcrR family transcriptional regulator
VIGAAERSGLLEAMLAELAEHGYREASIERALQACGISAADFEAEFAGKDECLLAAYDQLVARLVRRATRNCETTEQWPERVRGGLAAVLDAVAAQPDMATVMVRTFPAIRPSFYERYVDLLERFLPFMREGREFSGLEEELPTEVELLAVGAAESIIFSELDAGRAARLPVLMPEILFSILVPFIGPDRAAEEMKSASAAL